MLHQTKSNLKTSTSTFAEKKDTLYLVLSGIFLTNAIIAEIVGTKIFSLEKLIGVSPAQVALLDEAKLDFNLSAGVILWPVVFITTDIINEYFGKRGVKKISFLTAALLAYMFVAIGLITLLPPADFWIALNNEVTHGNLPNINEAFSIIFRQGLGIIIGSLTAFLIGQLLDVSIFQWLRKFTGSQRIWLRATGSTLLSQLVDSFVVIFIAFYVFGNWTISYIFSVGIVNYLYKFFVAILLTPILYVAHF
ncbi:MAG: queuosine precursor transporter, partial [Flammeovirgaceae bacterium]|nr:queuosine precursor transporter [Flammeovirgaceae bacterium]